MKKLFALLAATTAITALGGCSVTTTAYSPGYNSDYVYSVGYYGVRPAWGNAYYSDYRWGTHYWFGQPRWNSGPYFNRWYGHR